MSFRKRNVGLSGPAGRVPLASSNPDDKALQARREAVSSDIQAQIPGVRPSPLDGRLTTSTGTQTLDGLLAGHAGLALGNSILIEENGTTDYAGTLLRFYAAEGVVQGHAVHVVGVGEYWGRDLPGLAGVADDDDMNKKKGTGDNVRMKIAWRYERLGEFGAGHSRGGIFPSALDFCSLYPLMKLSPYMNLVVKLY